MIEDKIEEERGIYNNFIAGYNEGIELTKKNIAYISVKKGISFLEHEVSDIGANLSLYFFPITHPRA